MFTGALVVEDLLFVSYAVPPERLGSLVPDELTLDTVPGPSGQPLALLSAVAFVNRSLSVAGLPPLSLNVPQLNFRTYVHPPAGATFFLRSDLGPSPLTVAAEAILSGVSMSPLERDVDFDPRTGRYLSYVLRSDSPAGFVEIAARTAESPGPPPPGFASWEAAADFITTRLVGYYSLSIGGLLRLDVAHPRLEPAVGELLRARYRRWERLGVLSAEEAGHPHSVLLLREAVFDVRLPYPLLGG